MEVKRSTRAPVRKVGLALGSGAARGLAHIGVLEVLEKGGIPIDLIAGTSAGAAIGAFYAQSREVSRLKELVLDLGWKRLAPLVDLALPKTGFIGGKKVREQLKSILGDVEFGDLRIPLACVATDIMTGEEVVIDRGSVLEAVMASGSIPVIFSVANLQGRYLVDGGLVTPVPVGVLRRMGADFVIAVNVIPDPAARSKHSEDFNKPTIFSVIMQSFYIASHSLVAACLEEADLVIEPQVAHIGAGEFQRAQECIIQGEQAAQGRISEIKRLLGV
jgi:NTE family protein